MPIPDFDGIHNILPPHLGDPTIRSHLAPYQCTLTEVCTRFDTSTDRNAILRGFLRFRAELLTLNIRGFQWLSGSFVEDIETQEARPPGDIDVVTVVETPDRNSLGAILAARRDLYDPVLSKAEYRVDHYFVSLAPPGKLVLEDTKYWYALFSHRRDGMWKGLLRVNLTDRAEDVAVRSVIGITP